MATKIRFSFSSESINNAIKQLEKYKKDFVRKNELFVERCAALGISVINAKVQQSLGDSDKNVSCTADFDRMGAIIKASIVVNGKDIVFIEFGAGSYYNDENHPKSNEFGFTIGSYGKGQGLNPGYWYYTKDGQSHQLSVGTQATMPIYNASLEIIKQVRQIAIEVFGG